MQTNILIIQEKATVSDRILLNQRIGTPGISLLNGKVHQTYLFSDASLHMWPWTLLAMPT